MMIKTIYLGALLLSTAAVSVAASAEQTFSDGRSALETTARLEQISVDGSRFVNESGETVIFRGVSAADPFALEEKGEWGEEYFEAIASWNANVVRIPVHPVWWREKGAEEFLKMLDDAVRWSAELGMYVIIDWHSIGNPLTDVYHRPIYLTDRGETFRFWYAVAERYKGNPTVLAYELWNEPTSRGGRMGRLTWPEYKAYMEELIYMIFQIDETAIPLIAGFNWGYDLTNVREDPIDFEGVGYVAHPYPQKRDQPWEPKWQEDWGFVAENYPMICTEFGFMAADGPGAHVPVIADEEYGEAIISFFEERGISWTAWVFDAEWSPQLISDWNDYTPTRQGRFFKQKMEKLNP